MCLINAAVIGEVDLGGEYISSHDFHDKCVSRGKHSPDTLCRASSRSWPFVAKRFLGQNKAKQSAMANLF